jgi:hypothetical protein
MRIYTVHIDPLSAAADREAILVKEGFAWPAFLFSFAWALWHGMWWVALGLVALEVALGAAFQVLEVAPELELAIQIGAALIIGFVANDLRRMSLDRRGFAETAIVAGADQEAATQRYFDQIEFHRRDFHQRGEAAPQLA